MSYEAKVKKRRKENRELLKELGIITTTNLQNCVVPVQPSLKPKATSTKKRIKKEPYFLPTRRSSRIQKIEPTKYSENALDQVDGEFSMTPMPKKERVKRDNAFGAVPDVPIGTVFSTRMEASHAGIHRPPVAGIHGNPLLGCFSLALSGGYEDDIDLGDSFVYTGEGGRDLKGTKLNPKNLRTAPQSKHQTLERGNLALSLNIQNRLPVRVLRGFKLRSEYAPEEGYRYDGLYNVDKYFIAPGLSGFNVYKFKLVRVKDQDPAPWHLTEQKENEEKESPIDKN